MNETEEEQEPVSYPDFSITIEKENKDNVLEFECKSFKKMKTTIFSSISIFLYKIFLCFFPDDDPDAGFHVRTATLVSKDEKNQKGVPYFINTENVDPEMYTQMKSYLEENGFNQDFSDKLIDLSTMIEGDIYVNKLEELGNFLN